ncbi:hypothetical protein GCM10009021_28600 [Halarchaeum nitratireducens]|uniref:Uncharacterized protein n=1 Tax=Halarchaeum nitratireducens TaxID=489913 RepID=A0A830GF25_9EURY|nr:hypothetical protein GCM10009021_28600 [Halarchaeum nitratireducens]
MPLDPGLGKNQYDRTLSSDCGALLQSEFRAEPEKDAAARDAEPSPESGEGPLMMLCVST